MWSPFKEGKTIGKIGSENGTIITDEEYKNSCRITMETSGDTAPFSITCGVYGLMCHTTFSKSEIDAKCKYENMKQELQSFIDSNDDEYNWCEDFTSKW